MQESAQLLLPRRTSLPSYSLLRSSYPLIILFVFFLIPFLSLLFHSPPSPAILVRSPHGHQKDCDSPQFKSETLKLLFEVPFALLFPPPPSKFEASAIVRHPHRSEAYVAFDNLHSIARLTLPHASANYTASPTRLLPWSDTPLDFDSGFEYLTYNASSDWFMVGREAVKINGKWHSETIDVRFERGDKVEVGQSCVTEFEFAEGNKGFEGASIIDVGGEPLLLGLCEGNFCKGGEVGRRAGNGRAVLMRRVQYGNLCRWETVEVVRLPAMAEFEDYSGIAVMENRVAIVSQSNSAMFVGNIDIANGNVRFSEGRVVDFPRGRECEVLYCNVEGIAWLDQGRVIVVSDSMKGKGKQPFECREKDEMVHLFALV